MNKTFLEYVAEDIISRWGTRLASTAVVFPNKRAALFMNEHLAKIAGKPIWSPTYITISELFRNHSEKVVGDSIKLICDLHKVFTGCTGIEESLDHFYGWGQLMLADFDDIDKNMADADKVFCNIKDYHALDDTSYLSEEQREMLKKFFDSFSDNHDTELKRRFVSLWSHFGDIYHSYNKRLEEQGIGYEGAVYREVATNKDIDFKYDRYIFVGFNMLQKVEQQLFETLKKQDKAFFYWDYDKAYMPDENQRNSSCAGHYIAMYQQQFPNLLDCERDEIYNNLHRKKQITYISSPTENAQAKYVSKWLGSNDRIKDGRHTAVVLCNEDILQPILHSLPDEADKVNITSGYQLGMTPIATLATHLLNLYTTGNRSKRNSYALQFVNKVLRHPYARYISQQCSTIAASLQQHRQFYPSHQTLTDNGNDAGLCMLFPNSDYWNTAKGESANSKTAANATLLRQLCNVIKTVGVNAKDVKDALFQESTFRMYTVINRLLSLSECGDLDVDTTTLRRLIKQLVDSTTIPFHGEPIVGIQIMGVLETRNLDFDHLLLLSCNEGNMPKGVNDSSFIPYSIRKAYGLTTIDNKVAIYSYYFHRLLQRATDITIMYNNATDNGQTGEMSRFMLQFMIDSNFDIKHQSLLTQNKIATRKPTPIIKDELVTARLNSMNSLSPSAINRYIRCQLAFFYQNVAKIKEPDENEEDVIDNRIFGNIFHKAAYLIYEKAADKDGVVNKSSLTAWLERPKLLDDVVNQAFDEELFKTGNKTPDYNGMQVINKEVITEYLRLLIKADLKNAPFTILAIEKKFYQKMTLSNGNTIEVGGIIDRLDKVNDETSGSETIRVVDYKTGHQATSKIKNIEEVFADTNISQKHSDYYLQAMLYSLIVRHSPEWNGSNLPVSPALIFIKNALKSDYDPVLGIGVKRIDDIEEYAEEFSSLFKAKVEDIFNPNMPFTPTDDKSRCALCPYKELCYN